MKTDSRPMARCLATSTIALALALGLAACNSADNTDAQLAGEAIARIAAPAGQQWTDMVQTTEKGGYLLGNPEAPIKLIEFAALSCSHCAEFAKESFASLHDNYVASGRVSYELRYFMLNPYDVSATLLATCGATEAVIPLSEQFWEWQPNMFANLEAQGDERMRALSSLPPQQLPAALAQAAGMTEFFASRGIPRDLASTCLADGAKAKALAVRTKEAADEFDVTGTPTFALNGKSIGSMRWAELEAALQRAGAR